MNKLFGSVHRQIGGIVGILILSAVWIGLTLAPPGTTTSGQIPAPFRGFQAPDFTLLDRNAHAVTLSDFRGQAVLINLWASWCGPCRAEMPAIQSVYDEFKDEGFVVLAVNATNQDSQGAAIRFADELNLTFPMLFDADGRMSNDYQLRALPSTFFVDAKGNIAEVVIGGPMAEALLRTRVERLLEGVE